MASSQPRALLPVPALIEQLRRERKELIAYQAAQRESTKQLEGHWKRRAAKWGIEELRGVDKQEKRP